MKIKRLRTNAFGMLNREYTFDTSLANLVIEGNEKGKSTMVAAITAALYGLLKRPTFKGDLSEWKKFQPIGNTSYRVEMEVALPDKELIIFRDFNRAVIIVRDKLTNKNITPEYLELGRDIVGERLLGLTREQFLKTALVKQQELDAIDKAQDLTTKIQATVDSSSGDVTANQAIDTLDDVLKKYPGKTFKSGSGMIETEIERLEQKNSEAKKKMSELEQERRQADKELTRLEKLGMEQREYEEQRKIVEYLVRVAELKENEHKQKSNDQQKQRFSDAEIELGALSEYANFPASEYETLVQLSGELNQMDKEIEDRRNELNQIKQKLSTVEIQSESLKSFAQFTTKDKDLIGALVANLKGGYKKIEDIEKQIEQEKEEIRADGFNLEEESRLRSKFEPVSERDKDFIARYDKTKLGIENETLRVETQLSSVENQIAVIEKTRKDKRFKGMASTAAGLILTIAGSILLPMVSIVVGIPLIVIGLVAAARGLWAVRSSRRISSEEYAELTKEKSRLDEEHNNYTQQLKDITHKLESFATEHYFESPQQIVDEFALFGQLAGRVSKLRRLEDNQNSAKVDLASFKSQAYGYWKKVDEKADIEGVTETAISKVYEELKQFLELQEEKHRSENSKIKLQGQITRLEKTKGENHREISDILSAAGIGETANLEEAAMEFRNKLKKHGRFLELKDRVIPELRNSIDTDAVVIQRQEKMNKLKEEIEGLEKQAPELANLSADKSFSQYSEEFRASSQKLTEVERERQTLRPALNTIEKYQDEYPDLEEELESCQVELQKVKDFQISVSLARKVLSEISKETHRHWANVLNERANAIISKLNPNYEQVKFDEDLSFTIKSKCDGYIWEHKQFATMISPGGRDPIYLAIRLALSDYFSPTGSSLPIILDEPFASRDDFGFEAGMKFILEQVLPKHQIIILTCHRQRHQWLGDKYPEWWKKFISEVHLVLP